MRKSLLSIALVLACTGTFAQRNGISVHAGANDFYGPQTDKYFQDNVYTVNKNLETGGYDTTVDKKFRWHPLVRFSYWRELNKHFDINIGLNLGNVDYPLSDNDTNYILRENTEQPNLWLY